MMDMVTPEEALDAAEEFFPAFPFTMPIIATGMPINGIIQAMRLIIPRTNDVCALDAFSVSSLMVLTCVVC